MDRVLVIGLDAVSWNVINKVGLSRLKNLGDITNKGASYVLSSTLPAHSAPAWTSAFTGVNPGKHGVYDFFQWTNGKREFTHSGNVRAEYVWETLGRFKKKSIVINVPMTYPSRALNGVMIAGVPTPSAESKGLTYPSNLKDKILRFGYSVDPKAKSLNDDYIRLLDAEKARKETASFLLKNYDWDLGIVVFTALDRIQHRYWSFFEGTEQDHDEFSDVIPSAFETVDRLVGELIGEFVDGETTLMVFSDHGFGSCRTIFFVNEWLRQEGHLSRTKSETKSRLRSVGFTRDKLRRRTPSFVRRLVPRSAIAAVPTKYAASEDIETTSSDAWLSSPGGQGIIMNQRKLAETHTEERVKNELCEKLSKLRRPNGQEKVIQGAVPREKVYWGPHVQEAPDIMLVLSEGSRLSEVMNYRNWVKSDNSGWHYRDGILINSGRKFSQVENVQRKTPLERASIMDVAPTIMQLFGIENPAIMDGKALVNPE